jgi:DNA-binding SARP family transcriptional activator
MSGLRIRVLGAIEAERDGRALVIAKPRSREVLGILVAARGRAVSAAGLIDDLWEDDPPAGAVGALRTFVGELRRSLDPDRPRGRGSDELVTVGDGYALRLPVASVDAWSVREATEAAAAERPERADALLTSSLARWRGSAFEEFAERPWAASARAELAAIRSRVIEQLADARIARGRPGSAVDVLDPFVVEQPWNEEAWRLLALALHRDGRSTLAVAVLRRAARVLEKDFGIAESPVLADLLARIERRDPTLDPPPGLIGAVDALARASTRAQLESSPAMLTSLALSGDITVARVQRLAAIDAAEQLGDVRLTAQVVGGFDAPGIWTRSDDEEHAAAIVAAAERALDALPPDAPRRLRARLLATIAMESRGAAERLAEADAATTLALEVDDPLLSCLVDSARYMQSFHRAGLASERHRLGAGIVAHARAADWPTYEITGLLIRLQAACALDDLDDARRSADLIDRHAEVYGRSLATVFTGWFRWTFLGFGERPEPTGQMPGFEDGLIALDDLTRALRAARPLPDLGDLGPHEPWARPLLLARGGAAAEAGEALRRAPDPPNGLLLEVHWFLLAEAAILLGDPVAAARCRDALEPARAERAAGSGVIDLGPVAAVLDHLAAVTGSEREEAEPSGTS